MKKIKVSFYIILITFFIFFFIEICFKYYFKETKKLSCYTNVQNEKIYVNQSNCYFKEKYFEKKEITTYVTNSYGERVSENDRKLYKDKLIFVGDSFTFGYLSDYEDTYPYNFISEINKKNIKKKFSEINLGVNGYQIDQVINILKTNKKINESNNFVLYGLTPNDLFDVQKKRSKDVKMEKSSLLNKVRFIINNLNLLSVKFISKSLLKNDEIYINLYYKRGIDSGYINMKSSPSWEYKYKYFENNIKLLNESLKKRLIILIIPQQIQIKLLKKGYSNDALAFDNRIKEICNKIKIHCMSLTEEIAKKFEYQTHFLLDGHLLPKVNKYYGTLAADKLHNITK
ncbi:MAG: SGNH/GDSL hydrolase family protein [Candidatus Pelagibacter sp.]